MATYLSQEWRDNISKSRVKITEPIIAKLREAFGVLATIEEACFYAQINDATYYRFKAKYPEVCKEIEGIKHNPLLTAKRTLINDMHRPETAKWLLERKDNNFKSVQKHEMEVDATLKVETKPLTEEEKIALDAYKKSIHDQLATKILQEGEAKKQTP